MQKIRQLLLQDNIYLCPLKDRMSYLLQKVREKPFHLPLCLIRSLLWEYAVWKAKQIYAADPHTQTWNSILSTK